MTGSNEFDCVKMKRLAQERVQQKYAAVPEREALRLQREAVLADPVLGPFLARLRSRAHSGRSHVPTS
jgi:hypothetical protein